MDDLLHLVAARGFFTRLEAIELGHLDRQLTAEVRAGTLCRVRRGYYTTTGHWAGLSAERRHLLRADAVGHSLGDAVAESHVTAALRHGLATYGVDLSRVHVTRLDGHQGRIEGDVVHHEGGFDRDDLVEVAGRTVMAASRAVIETGITSTPEGMLVTADSFLHHGFGHHDDLMARFQAMASWPHKQKLHVPVRMADAGSASAGESRGRWLFRQHHLPAPVLQYEVRDASGRLIGTCDWAWPEHRLLGEFDGRLKYGRLLLEGQDAGDVVFAEKQREDLLREVTDFRMVRLVWSDYDRPRTTAARVRDKLAVAA